jgi:DNA recombination protein RmuC
MLSILIVAVVANGILVVFLLIRRPVPPDLSALITRSGEESMRLREEARAASVALRQEVIGAFGAARSEASENRRAHRDEISRRLDSFNETLVRAVRDYGITQRQDLESIRTQVEKVSSTVDDRLKEIQATNVSELQQMRITVDEKLQGTLNQRLGESFALVTERLELVHKGLGEMQALAAGVGDLKKVLSNVKSRGGWGEVQLESILEQMLSPEQYQRNVVTKEVSREAVEFAVKFPGKGDVPLLLPIDAKFPVEDHQHLVDAYDRGDRDAVEAASRRLETSIKNAAKTICEKYLNPPVTTDFAIMFLPTEGLYAEILRRPGLVEQIQRECGILIAGPTTLTAILSSLQMGFRTLAIEQRSSEVWRLLEAMKTEFGKFGRVIDKVNKNLDTARNHMDALGVRSRVVARKLRDVQSLPEAEAKLLLKLKPLLDEPTDEDPVLEDSEPNEDIPL